MPVILAHRGNTDGPSPADENRLPTIRRALARGWGLELDIRRAGDGRFYISHDPLPAADDMPAEAVCRELRRHPQAVVALNLKALGDEAALVAFLDAQQVVDQVCVFDMELLESIPGTTARAFHALDARLAVAARVSDRSEPVSRALGIAVARIIWLDEFDSPWATGRDVARMKALGRAVYAVSPDLHGHGLRAARRRWLDFLDWGVDAICTDYPDALESLMTSAPIGVAV